MSEYNPVTQFRAEAIARHEGEVFALAGGAWLVCVHEIIKEHGLFKKGAIYFRDYFSVYCYDDGCALSVELRASAN